MNDMDTKSLFDAAELLAHLQKTRARTLALIKDLTDEQMLGPRLDMVNPPLWELGHLARIGNSTGLL